MVTTKHNETAASKPVAYIRDYMYPPGHPQEWRPMTAADWLEQFSSFIFKRYEAAQDTLSINRSAVRHYAEDAHRALAAVKTLKTSHELRQFTEAALELALLAPHFDALEDLYIDSMTGDDRLGHFDFEDCKTLIYWDQWLDDKSRRADWKAFEAAGYSINDVIAIADPANSQPV